MAKKHEKTKTEDGIVAVEEALSKTEKFIEQNQRILTYVIGGIIILVLGFFGVKRYYVMPKEKEAKEQMFMAERYFEQDSLNLALDGDGMYPGFLDIIDDYGITRTANLAKYYTGIIYLRSGDFEKALDFLGDYKCRDEITGPLAKGAMGDAYLELGRNEKAASYYLKAAEMKENSFSTPLFYFKAAMTYDIMGKPEDALEYYQKIKNDYPRSNEAREIDKYIARATAASGR